MTPLATPGALIEVTPADEIQHWPEAGAGFRLIDDPSPFRFRVAGELVDDGFFYGLQGPVESGPERYRGLVCSILIRYEPCDWHEANVSGASFKVAPSAARRCTGYRSADHGQVPFHHHPEGTVVDGYPRTSRYGAVRVVGDPLETPHDPTLRAT